MTKIYEGTNHILIYAGYENPARHRHMAAQIILTKDDPMVADTDGRKRICRGLLIPSGVMHRIHTNQKQVLVFLYHSSTNVATQNRSVREIPAEICGRIWELYAQWEREKTSDGYRKLERTLLDALGIGSCVCCVTDERILTVMGYIRNHLSERISCKEAAELACLSQSRFSHLFRQQVGMTFAAYLVCQRLLFAYTEVLRGKTVTEAAFHAGFSGSAHFADVNRRVFGLSATGITRESSFFKIE